jgi:exopolysaccharide biosynthesis polyprenyl glycosylphosphotransferase
MPVREVALDRDIRSPRLLPSPVCALSWYSLRRLLSVLVLLSIDLGALGVALAAQAYAADSSTAKLLWPGLTASGLVVACVVLVACLALNGLYGRLSTRHRPWRLTATWGLGLCVSLVLLLFVDADALGARLVAVWLLAWVLAFCGRWLFDAVLEYRYGKGGDLPRALLVGSAEEGDRALQMLAGMPTQFRVSVVGLVRPVDAASSPGAGTHRCEGPPVVGTTLTLPAALRSCRASEVILADPHSLNGGLQGVMDACRTSRVALKVVVPDLVLGDGAVSYVPGLDCPLFVVRPKPAGSGSFVMKRVADIVLSALLLVLLSPLLLLVAALVKLTSRGPVLFVSDRVGIDQRPFRFYKFRTMVADAPALQCELEELNEADGVLFKMCDDPRVTRVGRVLRRLSIDELPQLLNVMKGDMSLVGPRPLPLRDCAHMEEWQRRRHVVQPGMTGLWQVSGRSDIGFDEMVELDIRYIETWSLWSDARIAWRTAAAVLRSRGAY